MIRSTRSALGALAAALLAAACGDASSFTSPVASPDTLGPVAALSLEITGVGSTRISSTLVNASTGECFATAGGSRANQTPGVLAPCSAGAAGQLLNLPAVGTAGAILLFDGALCLDDFGAQGKAGDVVGSYTCYPGAPPQMWTLTSTGALVGINGLCVTASGSAVTLQPCNGLAAQRWVAPNAGTAPTATLPATAGRISSTLVNASTGGCFATAGGSRANQTPGVLAPCSAGAADQLLNLPAVGTAGAILLFDGALCLDDFGAQGKAGDVVGSYTCYPGAPPQMWTLTSTGALVGINGLCVTASGSAVTLQPCNGLAAQRWVAPNAGTAPTATLPATAGRISSTLVNASTGGCFATAGGSRANQTPGVLAPCSAGAADQLLNLPAVGTAGAILLFDGALCLDDFGAQGKAGDVVGSYTCYPGAPPQMWTLTSTGALVGINGLCVTASGSAVTLQPCNGLAAQRWVTSNAGAPVAAVPIAVATVAVTLNSASLTVGQNTQAVSVARAADGGELARAATWSSSSPTVASVSPTGHVTALSPGTAAIVAYIDGKIGAANVTVAAVVLPLPGPSSAIATPPELPRVYLDTRYVAPTGRTIHVSAGQNLQTTLDTAKYGDVILLQPGATFVGNFLLRPRPGSGRVTLRTNTALPAEGERMTPAKAGNLAKLVSGMGATALATEGRASGWRIIGVEITMLPHLTYGFGIVGLGEGTETSEADLPRDLVLDRVYIHGHATSDISRCVALNSAASAVIDSYLSECHGKGRDTQAIGGWNGPGPFKIVNNYLEGSGENVMFGGGMPRIVGLVPSDIEIRGNHLFKPMAWQASGTWLVKNILELKAGRRVLIDGNVMENNWAHGQSGTAIVMFTNDEGGQSWNIVSDVTFTNNIVRNSAGAVGVSAGYATAQIARRMNFRNNLFDRIGDSRLGANGKMFQLLNNLDDVSISNNTFVFAPDPVLKHTALVMEGAKPSRLEFMNNVTEGMVAIPGLGGTAGLDAGVLGWMMAGNVIPMTPYIASLHPAGNYYPANVSDIGFEDWLTGDVRLGAGSSYRGRGTDGRDPGVNYAILVSKTSGVIQP